MLSNLDLEREKKQALARESDRNANDDDRRDTRRAPNRKEAMKLRGMIYIRDIGHTLIETTKIFVIYEKYFFTKFCLFFFLDQHKITDL